ncbi:unnamed protein product [Vitrella brassicaformis CCMP3155]|uniref:SET domain-containing protein n=2 Tax=Vitrella brassicaformis TaxID=1169539 RepID=A0A0G4EI96_VITBC|nr:unnamed protein product [Vitrella brassicaformis CCMP3155]|eukprot:CEL95601.1 unnamed protein product [Vitrella brassicaformis CCMP3155]
MVVQVAVACLLGFLEAADAWNRQHMTFIAPSGVRVRGSDRRPHRRLLAQSRPESPSVKDILSPLEGPLVEVVMGERNVTDLFRDDRSLWEKTRGQTDRPGAATTSKLRGLRGLTSDDIKVQQNEALAGWLFANGVYLSEKSEWGLAPHACLLATDVMDENAGESAGRGLLAKKQLDVNEEVLSVPLRLCFTKDAARRVFGPDIVDDGMSEHIAIALLLIHERAKGDDSFFFPYLDVLPTIEEVNPTFVWPEEDVELLRGSQAFITATSLREKLLNEYDRVRSLVLTKKPEMFPEDVFTFEAWLWAFIQIFSRSIRLQLGKSTSKEREEIAMVPYADLINHSPFSSSFITAESPSAFLKRWRGDPITEQVRVVDDDVKVYTDRAYKRMEQVYVSYGQKSNADLLLLYGFALDRNPHNTVSLDFQLDPNDELYDDKMAFVDKAGLPSRIFFPVGDDKFPSEMFEFVRLMVIDKATLGDRPLARFDFTRPLSEALENRVLDTVIEQCAEILQRYPTTDAEDEALISDRGLFSMMSKSQRMAVRMRFQEKRILKRTMAALKARRKNVKMQVEAVAEDLDIPEFLRDLARQVDFPMIRGKTISFDSKLRGPT